MKYPQFPVVVALTFGAMLTGFGSAAAQVSQETLRSISTPDKVETRIGTLQFKDGVPGKETSAAVYDNLDFTYAFRAFTDTFQGVSVEAIRQGLEAAGVKDNELVLFSKLMDSSSIFLTANADTIYYFGFINLSNGPMVLETPPGALGTIDDMWFRWVTDFGRPGPDRGEGGKYLLVGPGYDGYLPNGEFNVAHSRTNRVLVLGRSFLKDDDPAPGQADQGDDQDLPLRARRCGYVDRALPRRRRQAGPER
jgi:hypothetical protein